MLFLAEAQNCIITTYHSYLVLARQILGWKKAINFTSIRSKTNMPAPRRLYRLLFTMGWKKIFILICYFFLKEYSLFIFMTEILKDYENWKNIPWQYRCTCIIINAPTKMISPHCGNTIDIGTTHFRINY